MWFATLLMPSVFVAGHFAFQVSVGPDKGSARTESARV